MIIGNERAVGELWAAAGHRMAQPRADRPGQPVYAITEPPEPGDTGLRAATLDDLEPLVPICAAAHEFELGIDPLERDPEGFRWRTRAQIADGRSWLWVEDHVVLFKAEASAWTPSAVQIQQVWVDPQVRGRGYGARGMRDLCRVLMASTPVVTLFVRTENAPGDRAVRIGGHVPRRPLPLAPLLVEKAILARHAESVFNIAGLVNGDPRVPGPLTARGVEQARALGAELAGTPIDLCVTTEFERVIQTADEALGGREVPRLVVPGLDDPRLGPFEGGTLDGYREWARTASSTDSPGGDGESRFEIIGRYAARLP